MNENTKELQEVKTALEHLEREHSTFLGKVPNLGHKVHDAADEARREWNKVTEGPEPNKGFVP